MRKLVPEMMNRGRAHWLPQTGHSANSSSLFGRLHRFDGALKAEIGGLGKGGIRGFAVAQQSEHLLNV